MEFRFDYSKTMMMKMGVAKSDLKGGWILQNSFEQVLQRIKIMDALTVGAPKIVYLVGWQYGGHDDKYPAFFEVNKAAKRKEDATARDSLLWLCREAKKYNTTLSLHINLSDAYKDSPLWDEYLKNDLILLNSSGKIKKTGTWDGKDAFQVRFAQEYKSGYFQKRVDELMELFPLREVGTVHVDAFFVRKGKKTPIKEEKIYRRKMIEYFMKNGVDVTSEFIYREWGNGYRSLWGKSDTVGLIPAIWNLRMTQKDYFKYPPQLLAGGKLNEDLQWDKDLKYLFYGNMHGENFSDKAVWESDFVEEFALGSLPYLYMNHHKLEKITGHGKKRTAVFSHGVTTSIENKTIKKNKECLKENETMCIPIAWQKSSYYAWSKVDCGKAFPMKGTHVEIYKITSSGTELIDKKDVINSEIELKMTAGQAYLVKSFND